MIYKNVDEESDAYEKIEIRQPQDGLVIHRKDYYYGLKKYCIGFSSYFASKGIQTINIYLNNNSRITIVAPENSYSFDRKMTTIKFRVGFEYRFLLHHTIVKSLASGSDQCTPDIAWGQDQCKSKYINNLMIDTYNCTAPWLLHFARYIDRCL